MKWKIMSRFGMKLALGQIKGPKKLISLDIGSLSTGLAVSCPNLQRSYLLRTIKCPSNSPIFIKKLRHIINSQQNLNGIIVGKPIYSQNINKINQAIDNIAKIMQSQNPNKIQQPEIMYCFEDQNWTTQQARQKIKQLKQAVRYHGHLHNEKQLEDGIAAMKILDRFLQYYNQNKAG